ncbi:MAG: class IV adenylate cyclase [Planctomycetes bacterium]|nr:class IV adenylate cyclase [Planctomycetota bacterium]MCD7897407.1 class IV adenylate cyclase [Planctomycetaceae bacterium]
MALEVEAKIRVDNLSSVRARLAELGAVDHGRVRERNWVLDRPDDPLYRAGKLLRVRNTGGDGGVLTVKTPAADGAFKRREEVEVTVDSTDRLLTQFAALGYEVRWIYEKYRTTFHWRGCHVLLDECPEIGDFVEVEGDADAIRAVLADLGLDPADHTGANYLGIWKDHLAARGEGHRHMVFSDR